jgi:hypothetical protein
MTAPLHRSPEQRNADRRRKVQAKRAEKAAIEARNAPILVHNNVVQLLASLGDHEHGLAILRSVERQILEFQALRARYYGISVR